MLLYDFHYRLGEYGQTLMLSGLAVRMAQALRINNEYSRDILCTESTSPSVVARESRRRLMWAVYALDAWTGRGNEQLTLLRGSDIKIQLPCNERNFGLRIPSVTETLGVGHVLQFLPPSAVPARPADNMGIMACYIRIVTLWKRIVAYLNGGAERDPPPWMPESEFAALDADMSRWRRELPDFVEYSPDTIYARLDSNQLGALVLIHCTYHHSYLELYKVSMPELFRPDRASSYSSVVPLGLSGGAAFPPEHTELLQALQADCYFHALQVTRLLSEAAEHGARLLSDSVLPFYVYDSSRVMLYYVARLLDPGRVDFHAKVDEALRAVEVNAGLLRVMAPLFPVSESLVSLRHAASQECSRLTFASQLTTVERWLFKARQSSGGSLIRGTYRAEDTGSIPSVEMSVSPSKPLFTWKLHTDQHRTSTIGSPTSGSHDTGIPVFSAPADRTTTTSTSPVSERAPPSRSTSWAAANTSSNSPHNEPELAAAPAAQHELPTASQHERPVPKTVPAAVATSTPGGTSHVSGRSAFGPAGSWAGSVVGGALDLDELQSFLSWDIYGIMDLGETISASAGREGDEVRGSEWSSMI